MRWTNYGGYGSRGEFIHEHENNMASPFTQGIILRGSHSAYNTLSAAVAFTPEDGATHMIVQAHAQGIWYSFDGTTPTAAAPAFYVAADDSDIIPMPDGIDAIRIIEGAASATISYQWVTDRAK